MSEKTGRKSTYKAEYAAQAEKLCKLGAINTELAEFFGVSDFTVKEWQKVHKDFGAACCAGKMVADAEVADKLFRRATGYEHAETHISNYQGAITQTAIVKHYAPDTTACIFWLKNRRPDLWRDRHELTGKDGKDLPAAANSDVLEVARGVAWLLHEAERETQAAVAKAGAKV